jgi:hypothetical protein
MAKVLTLRGRSSPEQALQLVLGGFASQACKRCENYLIRGALQTKVCKKESGLI